MRRKDLLGASSTTTKTFKDLDRRRLLPFGVASAPNDFESMSEAQREDHEDRFWADYSAQDAIALKLMVLLYQDLRLVEVEARRPQVISRDVARHIASNFVVGLIDQLIEAASQDQPYDVWCAWFVREEIQDSQVWHNPTFKFGRWEELLNGLPRQHRVICVNGSAIAREVYGWLIANDLPEASELVKAVPGAR